MKKALRFAAVLISAQLLLVAGYLAVRNSRRDGRVTADRLSRPAPELALVSHDGSVSRLSELRGSRVVVHFWATWCPPCREELPSLLEFASSGDVEVLAVSVDPEWQAVRRFVGDASIEHVYLASSDTVADDFGVGGLPHTFVVDSSGILRLQFRGAQDWQSRRVRSLVLESN